MEEMEEKMTKKAIRGIRGKPGKKRSSRIDFKALVFRWLDNKAYYIRVLER